MDLSVEVNSEIRSLSLVPLVPSDRSPWVNTDPGVSTQGDLEAQAA